jgi:transposase
MTPGNGQRCPGCRQRNDRARDQQRGSAAARGYDTKHRNRARKVVAAAIRKGTGCCYCGGPPTGQDPFVGCHIDAQSRGGDPDGPLAAGHRSCNSAAAGKLNQGSRRS